MKKLDNRKLIFLSICFLVTGIIIHNQPQQITTSKNTTLNDALDKIKGWETKSPIPLDSLVTISLKLDDYISQVYTSDGRQIALYIGYYFTNDKIGAAHDPLVCFPGQGWVVGNRSKGVHLLDNNNRTPINYSTMIVEKGEERQLILYWFQSYETTNPGTFSQKINSMLAKITAGKGDSAFVRISIPIGKEPIQSYKEAVLDFVNVFYPLFLEYVRS